VGTVIHFFVVREVGGGKEAAVVCVCEESQIAILCMYVFMYVCLYVCTDVRTYVGTYGYSMM